MVEALKKNPNWKGRRGPVVLVIMDGVGYGKYVEGDAVAQAMMNTFRKLEAGCPQTRLKAHGTAVGLPSDEDMGNSEVVSDHFALLAPSLTLARFRLAR